MFRRAIVSRRSLVNPLSPRDCPGWPYCQDGSGGWVPGGMGVRGVGRSVGAPRGMGPGWSHCSISHCTATVPLLGHNSVNFRYFPENVTIFGKMSPFRGLRDAALSHHRRPLSNPGDFQQNCQKITKMTGFFTTKCSMPNPYLNPGAFQHFWSFWQNHHFG